MCQTYRDITQETVIAAKGGSTNYSWGGVNSYEFSFFVLFLVCLTIINIQHLQIGKHVVYKPPKKYILIPGDKRGKKLQNKYKRMVVFFFVLSFTRCIVYFLLHSFHISTNLCFLSNGTKNMHILASGPELQADLGMQF
jgi:hypothetical protein